MHGIHRVKDCQMYRTSVNMKYCEIQLSLVLKELEWFLYWSMSKTSHFKEILEFFLRIRNLLGEKFP